MRAEEKEEHGVVRTAISSSSRDLPAFVTGGLRRLSSSGLLCVDVRRAGFLAFSWIYFAHDWWA